jgi:protein tyrosine/serine phosphatase
VTTFDLSAPWGRLRAYTHLIWSDHGFLRVGFQNAHWISPELVRTNQPFPFQLNWWAARGIKTVVNLRGANGTGLHALEREACARLGLTMEDFTIYSRAVPTRQQVLDARDLFERIEYPALMHCKSGSDRAGVMSVFYKHFREGLPIREAVKQLSMRFGHARAGLTGVLDYTFERYLAEAEPKGLSFVDWVESPDFDPDAIKRDYRSQWWGRLLTEGILRRE